MNFLDNILNKKTKHIWDLEENKGFKTYKFYTKSYKIRKNSDKSKVKLLFYSDKYIQCIQKFIKQNKPLCIKNKILDETEIFCNTPYTLQEIPENFVFNGLNKPKNIYLKDKNCKLKTKMDNRYLASKRLIMLNLNHTNLKDLILHEITHTMCNHVIYREKENHGSDFKKCEKFLKLISEKSPECKKIEKKLFVNSK